MSEGWKHCYRNTVTGVSDEGNFGNRSGGGARRSGAGNGAIGTENAAQADHDFLVKTSEGNVSEIKLEQLALHEANTPQVRQFAQRMIDDHAKAEQQLVKDAGAMNLIAPDHMTKDPAGLYDKLNQESGAAFDKDYMNAMVNDHQDDVNTFQDEIKNGKNEQLKSYAQSTTALAEHQAGQPASSPKRKQIVCGLSGAGLPATFFGSSGLPAPFFGWSGLPARTRELVLMPAWITDADKSTR
jgi:putative membrane protein